MSRQLAPRSELLAALMMAGRQLSTATVMFHQAIADRLGLNVTDHKCIDLLLMKGPLTAGELAGLTGLTTGAITAVIDRLEKAGFAQRPTTRDDRRRVIVEVVGKRLREVERLFVPFAAMFGELSARYSDKELDVILDFMNRSCDALHESTVGLRRQPKSTKTRITAQPESGRGARKRPPR